MGTHAVKGTSRSAAKKKLRGADLEQQFEDIQALHPQDLEIRDKQGKLVCLAPNKAQAAFEDIAGKRNIVLKARQVGITTWVAARFFLATIQNPGTMTVQVAHDQSSAEAIFRIVYRFLENLPDLKTHMSTLVGNGQPGRVRLIEERMEHHEAMIQRGKTLVIALLPALGIFHLILHFAGKH